MRMRVFGFRQSRQADTVASTIAMLIFHDTLRQKELVFHVLFFLLMTSASWNGSKTWEASTRGEINKYYCFNNLFLMTVKICEIALFTRATPSISLVNDMK